MRLIQPIILSFLLIVTTQAFAEKMLVPPNGQVAECSQSYENADQPKTANTVLSAMTPVCLHMGGLRVMHKEILGGPNETTKILFTCIGDNPSSRIFSCLFSTSFEDL